MSKTIKKDIIHADGIDIGIFKVVEFDHFKKQAGLPLFTLSVSDQVESTDAIGELIQISDKKTEFPDYGNRHVNKAKNGWYRYDTRFGIPVYSEVGEIERYNIFRARMLVRCDANGKLFLYDIVQIKKETSTPLE